MSDDLFTKMCDCEEIQGKWEPKVGDWTQYGVIIKVEDYADGKFFTAKTDNDPKVFRKAEKFIWLPSETDLWGMLPKDENYELHKFSEHLPCWRWTFAYNDGETICTADTAQQALIQGVMWELHGKKWDGEQWK